MFARTSYSERLFHGKGRFVLLVVLTAMFLYLCLSMVSDPLSAWIGRDYVPGSMDENLGGRLGALVTHFTHAYWGMLSPLMPGILLYLIISVAQRTRKRIAVHTVGWTLAMGFFAAGALSALSPPRQQILEPGAGGLMGDTLRSWLIGPLGPAGALIVPAAVATVLVGMRVRGTPTILSHLAHFSAWLKGILLAIIQGIRHAIRVQARPVKPTPPPRRGIPPVETPDPSLRELPNYLKAYEGAEPSALGRIADFTGLRSTHKPAPATLFASPVETINPEADQRLIDEMAECIVDVLASFKIQGQMQDRTEGARVIRYHFRPNTGVRVSHVENLEREISLALKRENVRVAPAAEHGAIGVEVPHPSPRMVTFRDLYESAEFQESQYALPVPIGLDLEGKVMIADLAQMPHLLVAGTTGSGKSVALNTILAALISRNDPESLRLILVDPKRVEFSIYGRIDHLLDESEPGNSLPHLRHPVIIDPREVPGALRWAKLEMERREEILRQRGIRNIAEYRGLRRAAMDENSMEEIPENLPYIVIVMDELADLMMGEFRNEIETTLIQLAQKARAMGIHLILSTQRPDANVFTGLLKSNIPTRMAFQVTQALNSRVILDTNGAERLFGNGDMLYLAAGMREPKRIQGAYISTDESRDLIRWCAEEWGSLASPAESLLPLAEIALDEVRMGSEDELFGQALRACLNNGGASTSLLQRRFEIGYGRAARIIDQMHLKGLVGESQGSRAREVLYDEDQLAQLGY